MNDWGYDWVHRVQNMGVDDNDFMTKTSTYSWAHDYGSNSFDGAQVVFYIGHGSMRTEHAWDDPWYPAASWDDGINHGMHNWGADATKYTSGDKDTDHSDNHDGCWPLTSDPSHSDLYMMLGGGYVPTPPDQEGNVVVALHWGCRQAYYWTWVDEDTLSSISDGFDSVREGEMGMWNGWHSHGQFGNGWLLDYKDYLDYAFEFGGAGEYWVDMTRLEQGVTFVWNRKDHCLASIVWGDGLYDILDRFEDSRLAGENNLPSVSDPDYSMYFFYGGCRPYPPFDSECINNGWGDECGPDGLVLPGDRNGLMTYEFKNGS